VATEQRGVFDVRYTAAAAVGGKERLKMKILLGRFLLCALLLLPQYALSTELAGSGRLIPVSSTRLAEVLAEQHGKVVLVNFWASWCTPCLKEIPILVDLAERYRDRGFELVPVALDDPGTVDVVVVPFLNKWFPDFISYVRVDMDMDTVVSVVDPAWDETLPSSYIIDRDGNVVEQIQGGKPFDVFEAAIIPLLDD
jgi:thiol-disulfide isomerase/thioredoxin